MFYLNFTEFSVYSELFDAIVAEPETRSKEIQ